MMVDGLSLSQHLVVIPGMVSVLGTAETVGMVKEVMVEYRRPLCYDFNNGVYVFYDELGRPWVTRAARMEPDTLSKLKQLITDFGLERGAYVPHSNDGGHFLINKLPKR